MTRSTVAKGAQSVRPDRDITTRKRSGAAIAFAAIDFETADYEPDSACAVAVVHVVGKCIVKRSHHLIRPPRRDFVFSDLHGITWRDVANAPTFSESSGRS